MKNVKDARQLNEWGEAQEIVADIDYLLGAVVDSEDNRVKCLRYGFYYFYQLLALFELIVFSVINIATRCQSAQFRAHLRSHGSSMKLFAALADASKIPVCKFIFIYLGR